MPRAPPAATTGAGKPPPQGPAGPPRARAAPETRHNGRGPGGIGPLEHELPAPDPPGTRTSWVVYALRLRAPLGRADRDRIAAGLSERGIGCGRYFAPIHLQPAYRKRFGFAPGDFPVCEAAAERSLALPFFNRLSATQIDAVCETLTGLLPE